MSTVVEKWTPERRRELTRTALLDAAAHVFGQRGLAANGVPYPLFVVSGLVPWFYFSNATSGASGSVVGNTQLISKVYFPRLAIPLAAVLANLVDLSIGLLLELVLLVVFGVGFGWHLLALPVLVALIVLTALGVSVWLSALDVQYRDVRPRSRAQLPLRGPQRRDDP